MDYTQSSKAPSDLHAFTTRCWNSTAARAAALTWRAWGPVECGPAIITYHRVAPQQTPRAPLNVTPNRFRQQLLGLLDRGYRAKRLSELVALSESQQLLPPRTFSIVFDDGYQNVFHHAWPILQELKIPATIFLPTAYLDSVHAFPFDSWKQGGQASTTDAWIPLTTEQCLAMQSSGWVELGSHTHTHRDFRGRDREFAEDLQQSLRVLSSRFGVSRPCLSWPFGFYTDAMVRSARDCGVRCCLTAECRNVRSDEAPWFWGRFGAEQFDSCATLAAKIDGRFEWLRHRWGDWRRRVNSSAPGDNDRAVASR